MQIHAVQSCNGAKLSHWGAQGSYEKAFSGMHRRLDGHAGFPSEVMDDVRTGMLGFNL